MFFPTKLAAVFGLLTVATAAPTMIPNELLDVKEIANRAVVEERSSLTCSTLAYGLNSDDCEHMASIGFYSQGVNSRSSNDNIWIGSDGSSTFNFTNHGNSSITLVVWNYPIGDYQSSFMNVRQALVTYSLPKKGDSVTISVADDVSGGWATLNNHATTLSSFGQISNTWGEFTTGSWATVDISREVNMNGDAMSLKTSNGCSANMNTCVFTCKSGDSCGDSGTYSLENCSTGSQTGASYGTADGTNPEGGCMGWSNGSVDVSLGKE